MSFALFTIKFLNLCNGFVLYIHINDGLMSVLVRGNKLDGNGKCKVGEENEDVPNIRDGREEEKVEG